MLGLYSPIRATEFQRYHRLSARLRFRSTSFVDNGSESSIQVILLGSIHGNTRRCHFPRVGVVYGKE
jgi:hypothetical protein